MAQRTEKNPPYGWRFTEKIVDDITELYSLSGGPSTNRQLVIQGYSGDQAANIVFNNLVDVNGNPISPTFTWDEVNFSIQVTINGLGTNRTNSSLIVNFETQDGSGSQGTTGTNIIKFGGNFDTYFTAIYTDYRGY